MPSDLAVAFNALKNKQKPYDKLWAYYDGDQPLKYTSSKLHEVFKRMDAHFEQNWCAVVVDSCLDRINLARLTVANNPTAEALLNEDWARLELGLEDDSVHLGALVCGESFIIAWPDPSDPQQQSEAYYNDPRLCHVEYDPEHPRKKKFAAKWFVDAQGKRRITLYYPDRLEYYVSRDKAEHVSEADNFVPDAALPSAANPKGVIPVFHFTRERRAIRSELKNVLTPQDAINKLLTDMLVAAEFGAYRQRYIISAEDPDQLLANLRNAPNEIWSIPSATNEDQPTEVGEFAQTDLSGYLDAIDRMASAVAVISRTPKHYLMRQGGDPSGEALIAMEAPLVKKCKQYIERWQSTWREVAAFVLSLKGVTVAPGDINPVFDSPDTVLPATQADVRLKGVQAGIPLVTILRKDEGWTETELAELAEDMTNDAKRQRDIMQQAMLEAQRQLRQPPENYVETSTKPPVDGSEGGDDGES
jgi:hypothetical protein